MFLASIKEVIPTPQTWVGAYNIDGDNGDDVGDDDRDDDCAATSAQVLSTPNLG